MDVDLPLDVGQAVWLMPVASNGALRGVHARGKLSLERVVLQDVV